MNARISIPYIEFFRRVPVYITLTVVSFFLYLYTLAPGVLASDGGEFQFAAWNFSLVHPTGYPLLLILGGVFQHILPNGTPAFRLNIFNAIMAACAVGVLYLAAYKIANDKIWSIVAAASFAVSRTFWFEASGAEAYALNALFLAILISIAARWKNNPSSRTFAWFCLAYGLALTHHRTIALWLPAFALYFSFASLKILKTSPRFQISSSHFVSFTLCFILPLLLYAYIPLRASGSPYFHLPIATNQLITLYDNTPQGLVNYILGRTFAFELTWDAVSITRMSSTPQLLLNEFGALGVVLGAIGFGLMIWRHDWKVLALVVMGAGMTLFFNAIYHIGDIAAFYIPVYLIWALLIADGGSLIVNSKASNLNTDFPTSNFHTLTAKYRFLVTIIAGVLLVGFQFSANFQPANRSNESPRDQWTKILSAPIPQNAILVSNDRDEMMPLWYIQYVEHTRTDLLGLFPLITPDPKYADIGRLTDSVLDSGRPIYFVKPMPGIEIKYRLDAATPPLARVLGRAAENTPQHRTNASIADRVRVLGYDLDRVASTLRISVYWQATTNLDRNYTGYVNLVRPHGGKIAQGDDHQLGGDFYPTTLWQAGDTLVDVQSISLTDVPHDNYRLFVGLYTQPDLTPLGDAEIGVIEVR